MSAPVQEQTAVEEQTAAEWFRSKLAGRTVTRQDSRDVSETVERPYRPRPNIDLASIMVGIMLIGIVAGVIAATIFAVIPWAEEQAANPGGTGGGGSPAFISGVPFGAE